MLYKISKETTVSAHFQRNFAEFQPVALSPLLFLSPCQLTMEKLCKLKPLHSGLSPAVLRDLQWPEINEAAHCQCWTTLLPELKPAHRAMLYNAMQEVMLFSGFSISIMAFHIFSSPLLVCTESRYCHVRLE